MRWRDYVSTSLASLRDFNAKRYAEINMVRPRAEELEATVHGLVQFHCEHEFSKPEKGCLESIFCSKCGALHPDWKRTFHHQFGFADGEVPVGCLIIDGVHYRTKASKPKEGE